MWESASWIRRPFAYGCASLRSRSAVMVVIVLPRRLLERPGARARLCAWPGVVPVDHPRIREFFYTFVAQMRQSPRDMRFGPLGTRDGRRQRPYRFMDIRRPTV